MFFLDKHFLIAFFRLIFLWFPNKSLTSWNKSASKREQIKNNAQKNVYCKNIYYTFFKIVTSHSIHDELFWFFQGANTNILNHFKHRTGRNFILRHKIVNENKAFEVDQIGEYHGCRKIFRYVDKRQPIIYNPYWTINIRFLPYRNRKLIVTTTNSHSSS